MDIYVTKEFRKVLKKSLLKESDLVACCKEMEQGLIDADYGGFLYKKRVAMPGMGKSGGYRTMIGARLGVSYFYLYMFPKNVKDNINAKEEKALKILAKQYLGYSSEALKELISAGELFEIENEK